MPETWETAILIPEAVTNHETCKIQVRHSDNYRPEMTARGQRSERNNDQYILYFEDTGDRAEGESTSQWETDIPWDDDCDLYVTCMVGNTVKVARDKLQVNGGGGGGPKGKKKPVWIGTFIASGKWQYVLVRAKKITRKKSKK